MRAFLNSILAAILAESITDEEYAGMNVLPVTANVYDQASYNVIAQLLEDRESVSSFQDRLIAYFKTKGFDASPNSTAKSQIFIGAALDC